MKNISNLESNRIIFLDYLRIIAFLSVLIGHKFYFNLEEIANNPNINILIRNVISFVLPLFFGGAAGVVIFFLISGYIITHVLQTENANQFLFKRFFRIYPLYIFAVIVEGIFLFYKNNTINFKEIVLQLTLFGDFFKVPYSLNNVEWTLRIEVLFYLFMFVLKKLNLIDISNKLTVLVLTISLCCLYFIPAFPNFIYFTNAYFNIYSVFLILGSFVYLFEKNRIRLDIFIYLSILSFFIYYYFLANYQLRWISSCYALIAYITFLFFKFTNRNLVAFPFVIFLSELTYSVYLLHNRVYDYLLNYFLTLKIPVFFSIIMSLFGLFLICHFCVKLVEKPGIKLGKWILAKF